MWGEVTPAERLRSVTRRTVSDDALAIEAADTLRGFASDPASLVVACRRVLAHHPAHGALWWVCARILAAPDPAAAAREAERLLDADRTANRLAATLPLLEGVDTVAVVGWPHADRRSLRRTPGPACRSRCASSTSIRCSRYDNGGPIATYASSISGIRCWPRSRTSSYRPRRSDRRRRWCRPASWTCSTPSDAAGTSTGRGSQRLAGRRRRAGPPGSSVRRRGRRERTRRRPLRHDRRSVPRTLFARTLRSRRRTRGPETPGGRNRASDCPVVPELLRPLR